MSEHNHRCECKHKRVQYCAKCAVCHCLDCGQEWVTRSVGWYYPHWYYGGYTSQILCGGGGATGNTETITTTAPGYAGTSICAHGGEPHA